MKYDKSTTNVFKFYYSKRHCHEFPSKYPFNTLIPLFLPLSDRSLEVSFVNPNLILRFTFYGHLPFGEKAAATWC